MKVKELIKLLQECNPRAEIKMEDNMHNQIPIYNIVLGMIVHDDPSCYVITPFEYNTLLSTTHEM